MNNTFEKLVGGHILGLDFNSARKHCDDYSRTANDHRRIEMMTGFSITTYLMALEHRQLAEQEVSVKLSHIQEAIRAKIEVLMFELLEDPYQAHRRDHLKRQVHLYNEALMATIVVQKPDWTLEEWALESLKQKALLNLMLDFGGEGNTPPRDIPVPQPEQATLKEFRKDESGEHTRLVLV